MSAETAPSPSKSSLSSPTSTTSRCRNCCLTPHLPRLPSHLRDSSSTSNALARFRPKRPGHSPVTPPQSKPSAAITTAVPFRIAAQAERDLAQAQERQLETQLAAAIQAQRGDYNGKVLSIRQDDLRTLAVIYDESPSLLAEQLIAWGVLNPEARRAMD